MRIVKLYNPDIYSISYKYIYVRQSTSVNR